MPKLLPLGFVTSRFLPDLIVCIASDGVKQITRAVNSGADLLLRAKLVSLSLEEKEVPPSDSGIPESHST